VAALRAANARLRAVVEAKDTEIAALEAGQARQAEVATARPTMPCGGS
jgi:hypothetical protein